MAAEDDKINAPLVAAVGIASVLILVAIIVGLQVLFFTMSDREGARKDPMATAPVLADYRAAQQEKLSSYKVLDPAKKVYAMQASARVAANGVSGIGAKPKHWRR